MTANLTSEYYSSTRDFLVMDTKPADTAAIVRVFNADFVHRPVRPGDGRDLVWSPTDSQAQMLTLIDGAPFPGSRELPGTASVPPRWVTASSAWQGAGRLELQVLRPGWQFRAGVSTVRGHPVISWSFMILPMAFFGSSSRNSITRGYL